VHYHELKESIKPELTAVKKEEKITKPPLEFAPKSWARPYQSIKSFGSRPKQSSKQQLTKPCLGLTTESIFSEPATQ
jgi:hypothetical protein